jgi:hypothetical protein
MAAAGDATGASLSAADKARLATEIQAESRAADANTAAADPEDPGTGGINPRTYEAKLRNAKATAAAAIGAGYEFSPEQIDKCISDAKDLINQFTHDWQYIYTIIDVKPPAPDPVSVQHAKALSNWGKQLMARNQSQIRFLDAWLESLQNAKTNYMNQEHLSETQWHRLTLGLSV